MNFQEFSNKIESSANAFANRANAATDRHVAPALGLVSRALDRLAENTDRIVGAGLVAISSALCFPIAAVGFVQAMDTNFRANIRVEQAPAAIIGEVVLGWVALSLLFHIGMNFFLRRPLSSLEWVDQAK